MHSMSAPKTNFSFIEQRLLCELDCKLAHIPTGSFGETIRFRLSLLADACPNQAGGSAVGGLPVGVGAERVAAAWGWVETCNPHGVWRQGRRANP